MKCLISAMAAALFALGIPAAHAKDQTPAPTRRVAARRVRQPAPEVQAVPGAQQQPAAESLPAEALSEATETTASEDPLQSEQLLRGSGIPSSPYPAGLSYMMTPQAFRVPYINRIYYPPRHYVHLCPYYPSGTYLGADWYKRILGHNPWLIHGCKRFNPYLTAAKQRHYAKRHEGDHTGHATPGGSAPCSDCERMEAFVAARMQMNRTASVQQMPEAEAAVAPSLPRTQLIARPEQPDAPGRQSTSSSAAGPRTSSVRFKPEKTANSSLPPWQRPPVVRR